ncbi:uncharacterized protein Gasu_24640 [Galdieria sulphuraria]|uniref:Uncharacterized protein n=1 Tax=Galdieria sulphuraria TaxID=130081 RepID=M2X1U7_GALSU|nr:uncharacterized protein Gasu_24640 [Galdieria sulphuraria]EME30320.1 hypothetical protein Gasu_24640 [Galdieria sulphuraria]|eukprot:XP_005706840.1 hypothetical protein Gasu_24640 [Galdieria sulphuraria]
MRGKTSCRTYSIQVSPKSRKLVEISSKNRINIFFSIYQRFTQTHFTPPPIRNSQMTEKLSKEMEESVCFIVRAIALFGDW